MKPTMSVMVVSTTEPARAGSIPIFFITMGSSAPAQADRHRAVVGEVYGPGLRGDHFERRVGEDEVDPHERPASVVGPPPL